MLILLNCCGCSFTRLLVFIIAMYLLFIYGLFVHVFVGGQRTTSQNHFSPSAMWISEVELRSSGLTAGRGCSAISPPLTDSSPPLFFQLPF